MINDHVRSTKEGSVFRGVCPREEGVHPVLVLPWGMSYLREGMSCPGRVGGEGVHLVLVLLKGICPVLVLPSRVHPVLEVGRGYLDQVTLPCG